MDPRSEGLANQAAPLSEPPAVGPAVAGELTAEAVAEAQYGHPYTGAVAPRPSRFYQAGLLAATVGNVIALYAPISVGLSLKINELAGEADRVGALSLVTGIGAIFALIANPLIGRLSDRTTWRIGRRRPWIIAGSVVGLVGLVFVGVAPSIAVVVTGWCLAQIGFNGVMAATTATLADQVAPSHRGRIGGIIGVSVPAGMALGAYLSSFFTDVTWMMIVPAVLGAALGIVFAFILRDRPATPFTEPFRIGQFFSSFVFNPRRYPDFGWVWLTKFLFMCAYTTGTAYTAYFLLSVLHLPVTQVAGTIALALIASGLGNFITSPIGGWLSDRVGVRRPFVAVAAAVAMAGLVLMAFADAVPMLIVGQLVLGLGLGCFTAVDLALATDTLPKDGQAAKNLGVFNIAAALPQSLVPAVAAPIIAAFGYPGLFITGAILGIIGAILVYRVRSVR